MLSIIIPTLNEEKDLPSLLNSIKKQEFSDYEIIIADAGSKDRTLEIARGYNAKIVPGGLPAKARNNGVKASKGDIILFLDADVVLEESFLRRSLEEFKEKKLDFGAFRLFPRKRKIITSFLFNLFYNFPLLLLGKILPHYAMGGLIKKEIFNKLGGFDETVKLAEDHELARRVKKIAKYGVLRSAKLFVSERRFEENGWLKTFSSYFFCELYMIFKGPVRHNIPGFDSEKYFKNRKNKL